MNTRIEVDNYAGEGAAAVRDKDRAKATADPRDRDGQRPPQGELKDRLSVDPLRGTDRYRLVLPLPLRI